MKNILKYKNDTIYYLNSMSMSWVTKKKAKYSGLHKYW